MTITGRSGHSITTAPVHILRRSDDAGSWRIATTPARSPSGCLPFTRCSRCPDTPSSSGHRWSTARARPTPRRRTGCGTSHPSIRGIRTLPRRTRTISATRPSSAWKTTSCTRQARPCRPATTPLQRRTCGSDEATQTFRDADVRPEDVDLPHVPGIQREHHRPR